MNKIITKLTAKERIGYGIGDTACHFSWDMAGMFLFFYFTDVYGISAAAAGTIMMIARIWDAIADPIVGIIADRTSTKQGKFRPYMLWFAIPLSVTLVVLFTTPDFGETGKIIYAASAYLLLSTFYTAVNLPYSALSGVMTLDAGERTLLNQYRFFLGFTGMFVVSFTILFKNYFIVNDVLAFAENINLSQEGINLLKDFKWGDASLLDTTGTLKATITKLEQDAFQTLAIIMGIAGAALLFVSYFSTKERIEPPKNQVSNLKEDLKNVFSSKPWLILFILGIVTFVLIYLQQAVITYYFKYYINAENDTTILYTATTISLIIGVLFTSPLTKRFEKRNVFLFSSAISGLLHIALFFPGAGDFYALHTINVLAKISIAPTIPLLWAMIADTADYSEWKNNRRATGLFFSATIFAQKLGGGIATGLAGWLLTVANYDGAVAVQTDEAVMTIRLLFSVVPGILYLVTAVLLFWYKLDDKTLEIVRIELENRRLA